MQPTRALLAKNNLLICLDAFGTLFKPTRPIAATYAEAATNHGIPTGGAQNAQEVADRFKSAFKGEAARNPNYGKITGLGAEAWWGNVIRNTFMPFLKPGQSVPSALVIELYQNFATRHPYSLYPDVKNFFLELQKYRSTGTTDVLPWKFKKIVVGIITNSDDRVPSILQSFDLQIGPRRIGTSSQITTQSSPQNDIDFVVLSYDVGHEKPDRRIFNAATSLFAEMLTKDGTGLDTNDFEKLYVGDELEKDYLGASAAGWHSVLLDREGVMDKVQSFRFGRVGIKDKKDREQKVLMARSLLHLGLWEPKALAVTGNIGPKQ